MRSRQSDIADGASVERALTEGLCGFGGVLDPPPRGLKDALDKARSQYDDRLSRRIGRFANAPDGAMVWTRDVDDLLWLGRLGGAWSYDASEAAAEVDLVHVRPCVWISAPVSESDAPGAVLATFQRGGKNWQQIHSSTVSGESERLWQARRGRDS